LKPLSDLPADSECRVRELRGGENFVSRMAALGFTVGVRVKMIQNYGHGPLITLIRDSRVALGRGEALKVLVEDAKDDEESPERSINERHG
jgi:ferrous iron transport protein A